MEPNLQLNQILKEEVENTQAQRKKENEPGRIF
jgi:hypothetical protein